MAADNQVCTVCGAKNPTDIQRCRSCGARLDALESMELTEEEELARRNQQESFEWKWVAIAFAIYILLQGIVIGVLPFVINRYDPQGLPGLLISAGVWFVGGMLVGVLSPGKTFVEPAVAALLAMVPTILWLMRISDVFELSLLAYIVGGLLGVMVTLLGAFLGEKIQMGTRGHAQP